MKKSKIFTVFAVVLGLSGIYGNCNPISELSPAEKSMQKYAYGSSSKSRGYGQDAMDQADSMTDHDMMDHGKSPMMDTDTSTADDHVNAYQSLSPKNQRVFKTLNRNDKQKVVDSYVDGDDHHKTINDILKKDQKNANDSLYDSSTDMDDHMDSDSNMRLTPADRAMRKNKMNKSSSVNGDNIFN